MAKFLNNFKRYWLFNIFLVGVAFIFIYAGFLAIKYIFDITLYTYQVGLLSIIIVLGLLLFLRIINIGNLSKKKEIFLFMVILLGGIGVRVGSMNYFDTYPTSDFKRGIRLHSYISTTDTPFVYHENKLLDNEFQKFYAQYPAWFTHDVITCKIIDIFGDSILYLRMYNLVLYSFTMLFLYLGVKNLFDKKVGFLSILIFSVMPSLIVYTNVLCPDHMTMFLVSIVIYLWSKILKIDYTKKKYFLTAILILFMNLINLFKPVAIYMLIVFICSEIMIHLCTNMSEAKKYFKRGWKYFCYFILLFLVVGKLVNFTLDYAISKYLKVETVNSVGSYLIWGYSVDQNGDYNSDYLYNQVYNSLYEKYEGNLKMIYNDLNKIAIDNIKNNVNLLPKIFNKKFEIVFGSERAFFDWANNNTAPSGDMVFTFNRYMLCANTFMAIMYFFTAFGALYSIYNSKNNYGLSLILLMIIGYVLILILGGVQGRYKALIFPELSIVFALGISYVYDLLNRVKRRLK